MADRIDEDVEFAAPALAEFSEDLVDLCGVADVGYESESGRAAQLP